MAGKILVADDSATIQKVVNITLAEADHEIEECLDEKALFKKLKSKRYDLILLDFGLSGSKSGEDLVREVYAIAPTTPIMVMLGGFDDIDESSWEEIGIKDSIVKPFESSTFIRKCHELLGDVPDVLDANETPKEEPVDLPAETGLDEIDTTDQWDIDAPPLEMTSEVDQTHEHTIPNLDGENSLNQEVSGWGMSSPASSQDSRDDIILPPKIGDVGQDDQPPLPPPIRPTMQTETDESTENLEFAEDSTLLREVQDEFDSEDFWSADEAAPEVAPSVDDPVEPERPQEFPEPEEIHQPQEPEAVLESKESEPIQKNAGDTDEIVEQVKSALGPVIENLVKEYCSKKVEQVAWEVIPDLAENLIRTEIKEVADRIRSTPS